MAEGKKAFVVYTNWKSFLDVMTNEQKGIWFSWVMNYCNDLNPAMPDDQVVCMAILMVQPILKRDLKKYEEKLERLKKNGKQYKIETDNDTEIETEIGVKTNQNHSEIGGDNSNKLLVNSNKKEVNNVSKDTDNILSQILRYWNDKSKQYRTDSFKMPTHKTITPALEKAINKALGLYGFNNITIAIEHYAMIGNDDSYYFNYVWTLEEFCKQSNALPEFLEDGSKWLNYINSKSGKKKQEQSILDTITIEDMRRDGWFN